MLFSLFCWFFCRDCCKNIILILKFFYRCRWCCWCCCCWYSWCCLFSTWDSSGSFRFLWRRSPQSAGFCFHSGLRRQQIQKKQNQLELQKRNRYERYKKQIKELTLKKKNYSVLQIAKKHNCSATPSKLFIWASYNLFRCW